jgi:hypothetical protein
VALEPITKESKQKEIWKKELEESKKKFGRKSWGREGEKKLSLIIMMIF